MRARPWSWLVLACGLALLAACTRPLAVDEAKLRAVVGTQPVVLLSASWCGYCRQLRADLGAWGVPFTEYDVEDSETGAKAFALLRGRGVPILLVNEQRLQGYVPSQVRESLLGAGFPGASAPP